MKSNCTIPHTNKNACVLLLALVVSVLSLSVPTLDVRAEPRPSATTANEAQFYAKQKIFNALKGNALKAVLSAFPSSEDRLQVRVLGIPSQCGPGSPEIKQWQQAVGQARRWIFKKQRNAPEEYFIDVAGADFGVMKMVNNQLRGHWYACPDKTSFVILTDATRRNFILQDGGKPLLGWSKSN